MKAIVLNSVQYIDHSYMVSLFTDQKGMVSVSVRTGERKSKFRRSYLLPLSILDIQITGKNSSEVKFVADCSLAYSFRSLDVNPFKMFESQFMAEMLHNALRYQQQDLRLFEFIENSIKLLDSQTEDFSDFHIKFLINLMSFVGITPDISNFDEHSLLDMKEGRMLSQCQGDCLPHDLSSCLVSIILDEPFSLNPVQRSQLIDFIVKYYQYHLSGFGVIKTIEVFREMSR